MEPAPFKHELKLSIPHEKFRLSYLAALSELTVHSEKVSWVSLGDAEPLDAPFRDFASYVNRILIRETTPPTGFVRDTTYWATIDDEVVGRIAIRHELNDFLKKAGGHVGYIVKPSRRSQGIASQMLKLILQTERARSLGKILITCDEQNLASEKTILKNGGVFESLFDLGPERPKKKRFWIELN